MATSGSQSVQHTFLTIINELKFSWERTLASAETNSSTIAWKLEYIIPSIGGITGMSNEPWEVVIDGTTYSGTYSNGVMGVGTHEITSGSTVIPHNPDGKKAFSYSFFMKVGASVTEYLDTILRQATIISAPNFTVGQDPTIIYDNPAGEAVTSLQACIFFTKGGVEGIDYRDIPKDGTSYTFEMTTMEKGILTNGIDSGTTESVTFRIRTIIDDLMFYDDEVKTLSLPGSSLPTLSPTVIDVDSRTTTLTGNNNIFVRYMSDAYFTLNEYSEDAFIDGKSVINGSQTITGLSYGTIYDIDSNTFYFSVTDSRGNTAKDFKVVDFIPYIHPTCTVKAETVSISDELMNVQVTFTGKYYDGNFGVAYNTLEFEYGLQQDGGDTTWTPVEGTLSTDGRGENATYTFTFTLTGLNYQSNYTIAGNVIDELSQAFGEPVNVIGTPIFDWSKNDFNFNVDVNFNKGVNFNSEDFKLGFNSYMSGSGSTDIYGDTINLYSGSKVNITAPAGFTINGSYLTGGNILWNTWDNNGWHMNASQTAYLSETISSQPNGILLIFSLYRNGAAENVSLNSFFVSKYDVGIFNGAPHTFFLGINAGFSTIGAKYLYIYDNVITGHEGNASSGVNSGITYNNSMFVLRYVIGV